MKMTNILATNMPESSFMVRGLLANPMVKMYSLHRVGVVT